MLHKLSKKEGKDQVIKMIFQQYEQNFMNYLKQIIE